MQIDNSCPQNVRSPGNYKIPVFRLGALQENYRILITTYLLYSLFDDSSLKASSLPVKLTIPASILADL